MSKILITVTLLSFTGALSAASAFAGESIDPHQRARDMIAPPIAYAPAPRGAMGRLIDATEFVDPQLRARQMIRAESSALASRGAGAASVGDGFSDPHERARHFVGGGRD